MSPPAIRLTVVVPFYNEAANIGAQLEALDGQEWTEPWEVVFSDNGSTDDTASIIRRFRGGRPNWRVIDASGRKGQAYARNVGAAAAAGDLLAFTDADDQVGPGWVAAMGNALLQHEFVACAVDTEKLNEPWARQGREHPQKFGLIPQRKPSFLPYAGGSTLGIHRRLHEAANGFDETLLVVEDVDYCWRVQLNGALLHFVPGAVVHVRYHHRLGAIFNQPRIWALRSVRLYTMYRQRGMPEISPKEALADLYAWKGTLRSSLKLRTKGDVAKWLWGVGWQVGRLQGSLKYRVLAF